MTREAAVLIMVAVAVVLLALMTWGWLRRRRRDRGIAAPVGDLPQNARVIDVFEGLYVATTAHDAPLERLIVRPLAFRSRASVTVSDAGVALDLPGADRVVLGRARLVDVGQSTVAIDRVVERDGLVRLAWRLDDDRIVDSYLRPQGASARALADSIRSLLPSGSDA